MGRKPNPLIGANFDRGPKLNDNSNRYEHTCKSCGQVFPKGRAEALMNHVLKKCPSITDDTRTALLSQTYNLPLAGGSFVQQNEGTPSRPTDCSNDMNVAVPRLQDGLAVLAEAVASQVATNNNDFNNSHAAISTHAAASVGPSAHIYPPDDVDRFVDYNMPDDNILPTASSSLDTGGSSFTTSANSQDVLSSSQATMSSMPEPMLSSQTTGLEDMAASANDMMNLDSDFEPYHGPVAEELLLDKSIMADPAENDPSVRFLHDSSGAQTFGTLIHSLESQEIQRTAASSSSHRRLAMHDSPASAHFITESGTTAKPVKPKVRGKFTPERRKEVQSIRQLGACLRCRMLKKPCSDGDPCQGCAAIETPRVWKRRCIREKLVDTMKLFSDGLESILSYREISNILAHTKAEPFNGYIEAFHSGGQGPVIILEGLQLIANSNAGAISKVSSSNTENECGFVILDPSKDRTGLLLQVDKYFSDMHSFLLGAEPSSLLQSALQTAMGLLKIQNDPTLARVMSLWSTVLVYSDPEFAFKLVARPDEVPQHAVGVEEEARTGLSLIQSEWPESFRLINSQLRAMVEKRAEKLAKGILVDLERRLIQKPEENRYHTFVAAVFS